MTTRFLRLKVGTVGNLELDVIGKYIPQWLMPYLEKMK